MRSLVLLGVLAAVNVAGYFLVTRPTAVEQRDLDARLSELVEAVAREREAMARWSELGRMVDLAQSVLEDPAVESLRDFSAIRAAFLDAERGLGLERGTVELLPESHVPEGLRGVRVRTREYGDFRSLFSFVERVSQWRVPLVPVEIVLAEEGRGPRPIRLTATWLVLWTEERERR